MSSLKSRAKDLEEKLAARRLKTTDNVCDLLSKILSELKIVNEKLDNLSVVNVTNQVTKSKDEPIHAKDDPSDIGFIPTIETKDMTVKAGSVSKKKKNRNLNQSLSALQKIQEGD